MTTRTELACVVLACLAWIGVCCWIFSRPVPCITDTECQASNPDIAASGER